MSKNEVVFKLNGGRWNKGDLKRRIQKQLDREALVRGMEDAVDIIADQALEYTPMDTGNLRDSQYRQAYKDGSHVVGKVGYFAEQTKIEEGPNAGESYAWVRHEVEANNYTTPGTGAGFLLRAFNETIGRAMEALRSRK